MLVTRKPNIAIFANKYDYLSSPPSKTIFPVFARGAETSAAIFGRVSNTWAIIAAWPYLKKLSGSDHIL